MTTSEILTRLKSIQRWRNLNGGFEPTDSGGMVKWSDIESLIEQIVYELEQEEIYFNNKSL